jgi:HPr kinase/phosphorylase
MHSDNPIYIHQIVAEYHLKAIYAPEDLLERRIYSANINRPALQLTGFFEHFSSNRIQVIGMVENLYLERMTPSARKTACSNLLATGIPMVIYCRSIEPCQEMIDAAREHNVPVFQSDETTASFVASLGSFLNLNMGARTTVHGVLVEVYGEGVLLVGDSGVGKSETAIELVKRGHRLVADDAVEVKKASEKTLVGTSPELTRYFMEIRGIGIIDVRRLFGMGAVKVAEKIDLVIQLQTWDEKKAYDRLGIEDETYEILGTPVSSVTIPVKAGRNLAVVIEIAAMNHRNKKMGYNAAQELSDKLYSSLLTKQEKEKE